ncbi:MAG: tRNA (guanosine(46)-N7)-methyltransferase TrmB [Pseudomonadota bacterium]
MISGDRHQRRLLYGRTVGHPLSSRQRALIETVGTACAVPETGSLTRERLFGQQITGLHLEIGFGAGEHLAHEASRAPDTGFIGAEPFLNGYAKMLGTIEEHNLTNVRLHHGDARDILERLAQESLDRVDLLYPDPWPKRRHRKRRFVGPDTLDQLAQALRPGGLFRFASDIADYTAWTLRHVLADSRFHWTAQQADDWRVPWPGWPSTRYEAKAIREGRVPAYLVFRRL